MIKRNRIEYLRKVIRRKETLQMGLPFVLKNELDKSLDDWRFKYNSQIENTIKLYDSNYSNIEWHIIKPTVGFENFNTSLNSKYSILQNNGSFRVKIPNHFFELDLEFKLIESNAIKWIDTETDKELLCLNKLEYHKFDNVSHKAKELVVREQLIQYLKEIWEVYNLPGCSIKVLHKRVHFVDTKTGIIEKAILSILSEIFGLNSLEVKSAINEKFTSIKYYFETMNYEYIDIYEKIENSKMSGDKLIYLSEHRDNASRLVKRLKKDDIEAINIKYALFTKGINDNVIISSPNFNDALVFRDNKENIEAIFHLSFETNVLQNEKGIFMDTNKTLFNNLKKALKSSR